MDATQAKHERMPIRAVQLVVMAVLLTTLLILSTPWSLGTTGYWVALPFLAAMALLVVGFAGRRSRLCFAAFAVAAGAGAMAVCLVDPGAAARIATVYAIIALLGGALPAASMLLLVGGRGRLAYCLVGLAALAVAAATMVPTRDWATALSIPATGVFGWIVAFAGGRVLARSIPDALRQVQEIGYAHRAERQASEMEANRRQSARLLHDTVLATLTLLAHSGTGVSADALRQQARNDAHLLRQLRLGEPLFSLPGTAYAPEPVEESTLGTTLESVRDRFTGMGLEVQWHGSSRVALPRAALDAFIFSISESLENVRRHAGVALADVTVTEADSKVTAMITDAGAGFAPAEVSEQRLGIKESVIGRLAEVGGSAKVFSAPGAGTTVILEVPR